MKNSDTEYLLDAVTSLTVAAMTIEELMEKAPLGFKERNDLKRIVAHIRTTRDHIKVIVVGNASQDYWHPETIESGHETEVEQILVEIGELDDE